MPQKKEQVTISREQYEELLRIAEDTKKTTDEFRYKQHKDICSKLTKTYIAKNKDYGNSFSSIYEEFGIVSAVTRISDKNNRLKSLVKKSEKEIQIKEESIQDTLLDMANYCIMTAIEIDVRKK